MGICRMNGVGFPLVFDLFNRIKRLMIDGRMILGA